MVLKRWGDDLPAYLQVYIDRQRNAVPAAACQPDVLMAKVKAAISGTPGFGQLFGTGAHQIDLDGRLVAQDELEFNQGYITQFLVDNADKLAGPEYANLPARVRPAAKLIGVDGYQSGGRMYVRGGAPELSTCIHETLHMLAKVNGGGQWREAFGSPMEEAAATYFTEYVCAQRNIPFVIAGYANNLRLLKSIIDNTGLTPSAVAKAYFYGSVEAVRQAIATASGPEGLTMLRSSLDTFADDLHDAWLDQRKKVSGGNCTIM
jgi:hypothetical protein